MQNLGTKWRKHRLTYYRWEWPDPFKPDKWTAATVSVYAPCMEYPFVSVFVSVANGGGHTLFRCKSLEQVKEHIIIPGEGMERLERAYTRGREMLAMLQRDMRILYAAKDLPAGVGLARTDTGEIVSDAVSAAERIIDGKA